MLGGGTERGSSARYEVIQRLHVTSCQTGEDSSEEHVPELVSVKELCVLFGVSRSGYYDHLHKADGSRRIEDAQLAQRMEELFKASDRSYGSPRLVDALQKAGLPCGKTRIRRLMDERGLEAKTKQRFRPSTTDSKHDLPVAPNLLLDEAKASRINQHWVNDITYIPTHEGWLYLAGTLDCYSRRIVGWNASSSLDREGVLEAARRAFNNRKPEQGLIYH